MIPILDNKSDLFNFKFPRGFVPKELCEKYEPYLNLIPGNLITDVNDYINYTVQGFSIPGLSAPEIVQSNSGITHVQRGKDNIRMQNIIPDKTLVIKFGMMSGNLNYWILYDTFLWYYSSDKYKNRTIDVFKIQCLDMRGNHVFSVEMQDLVWTDLSGLEFDASNNVLDFNTFECTFKYIIHNVKYEYENKRCDNNL